MARKKKHEEHENHERWLVSYADFITLLFAFFVVMYSVSSVNEGKYRVLSNALVAAFRAPAKSVVPIQVGEQVKSPSKSDLNQQPTPDLIPIPGSPIKPIIKKEGSREKADTPEDDQGAEKGETLTVVARVADRIEQAMAPLIEKDLITVRRSDFWAEVEIKTSILYPSGSARLMPQATPVLYELADILTKFTNPIRIEGFTDNIPIKNALYPSNWELSTARAASVVRLFMEAGIDPPRLAAIGYAEFRPIADNETPEGRRKNRRVVLLILENTVAQRVIDSGSANEIDTEPERLGSILGQALATEEHQQAPNNPQSEIGSVELNNDSTGLEGIQKSKDVIPTTPNAGLSKDSISPPSFEQEDGNTALQGKDSSGEPAESRGIDATFAALELPMDINSPIDGSLRPGLGDQLSEGKVRQ